VRYARSRVKGAMLDELRQMDHLGRGHRRKIKAVQIARERLRNAHGREPTLAQLAALCEMSIDELAKLEHAEAQGRALNSASGDDADPEMREPSAATPHDEVEARVDTAIVLRRLERFFAALPPRERRVIDAYLGVGLTPTQLAAELKVSPSRVSQMFKALVQRTALHFGQDPKRAVDRLPEGAPDAFERRVALRELELASGSSDGAWGRLMERALTRSIGPHDAKAAADAPADRLRVDSETRWG
jgi:RNA polymerase sigma factor for flagellar operon FliA